MSAKDDCIQEGGTDRGLGFKLSDNPHAGSHRKWWKHGWLLADYEKAKEEVNTVKKEG